MNEQTISKENQPQQVLEALSDILLVLDKKKNRIEAVKGMDEEGNLQTSTPKKSNLLDFMRVDKGDAISNFFSNFWRRLNDPLSFRFSGHLKLIWMKLLRSYRKPLTIPLPRVISFLMHLKSNMTIS